MDLNDRDADPQGQFQIFVVEMKDNGNTSSGAITGTGSGNKAAYCMQFALTGQTAGTYEFSLELSNQTANVETSMWNIVAKFERYNLT